MKIIVLRIEFTFFKEKEIKLVTFKEPLVIRTEPGRALHQFHKQLLDLCWNFERL